MQTSGSTDAVWVHLQPYTALPSFSPLTSDLTTDVCIVGAGIAGISTAYELVKRGKHVVLLEARDVLSGETGRTSGHLTNDLDDGYREIAEKHGEGGAKAAAESHAWARDRIGEIASEVGIDCEYRRLPAYDISQFARGAEGYEKEMSELRAEAEYQKKLGVETRFDFAGGPAPSTSAAASSLITKQLSTRPSTLPAYSNGCPSSPTSAATPAPASYRSRRRVLKFLVSATRRSM